MDYAYFTALMEECHRFTMEDYHKLPLYRRLGGKLLKLFAPLL